MKRRLLIPGLLLLLFSPSLVAQNEPPVVTMTPTANIKEEGILDLSANVVDPDDSTQSLTYSWTIPSDPTGSLFFRLTTGGGVQTFSGTSLVRIGLSGGANYPGPTYVGQQVVVQLDVSDGVNTVTAQTVINVIGVNQRPILTVDTRNAGTTENPKLTNEGFSLDASASIDPDTGKPPKMLWRITGVSGGTACDSAFVLLGKETTTPGFAVPRVSAVPSSPMFITVEVIVEDDLIVITESYRAYFASPNGCSASTNPPPGGAPTISSLTATPSIAGYGQQVTLSAGAPSGLSYSWVQLSATGSADQVSLTGGNTRSATFVAPAITTDLRFRFTVTDAQNQSTSQIITVPVRQSGGGTNPPPSSGGTGTPSGVSAGTTVCTDTGNSPATATVPAMVSIEGGGTAEIRATNGRDPDNTSTFVSGQVLQGVAYSWNLVNGNGAVSNGDLSQRTSSTLRVVTRPVTQETFVAIELNISDPVACGTTYPVTLAISPPQTPNQNPVAQLNYQIAGDSVRSAGAQPVTLTAPAEVTLDASGSSDPDGTLSFAFTMQQDLTSGGAVLSQLSQSSRKLVVQQNTEGTIIVTMTVTDDRGATATSSIQFVIDDVSAIPVAVAAVMLNDVEVETGSGVEESAVVTLDGSESALPDSSQPTSLTYEWRQVAGPPVNIVGADQPLARFRAPEVASSGVALGFELIVRNGGAASTPAGVEVTVEIPALYMAQIAFGLVGPERLQTTIIAVNNQDTPAENVHIEFYNQQGEPLAVGLGGEMWDPDEPVRIPETTSRIFAFESLDPGVTVGWAKIVSDVRLTGLVLYQLVDAEDGRLNSEVSLFSSQLGSRFATFYGINDGLAVAIANPGTVQARILIKLIDDELGPDLPLVTRPVILQPGTHMATFLDQGYFGQLPPSFTRGTIVIETVKGRVVATVLKTVGGLPISTLPLARRR